MRRLVPPLAALTLLTACGTTPDATIVAAGPANDTNARPVARWERGDEYAPPQTTTTARASRSRPRPAPVPAGRRAGGDVPHGTYITDAICQAFGPECGKAIAVAHCESTLNPRAVNGQFRGLFQVGVRIHAARIARLGYTPDQMLEVGPNIAVAVDLRREQGWRPWECA